MKDIKNICFIIYTILCDISNIIRAINLTSSIFILHIHFKHHACEY